MLPRRASSRPTALSCAIWMLARTGADVNRLPSAARKRGWLSISNTLGGPSTSTLPAPPDDELRPGTTTTVFWTVGLRAQIVNGIVVLVPGMWWAQRPGTLASDFDEALANGVENRLRTVVNVEFLVHVAHMVAH